MEMGGGGMKLEGVERGKTVVGLYCLTEESSFNLKKRKRRSS